MVFYFFQDERGQESWLVDGQGVGEEVVPLVEDITGFAIGFVHVVGGVYLDSCDSLTLYSFSSAVSLSLFLNFQNLYCHKYNINCNK